MNIQKKANRLINFLFVLYFLILFAERTISIVCSIVNLGFANMFGEFFNFFTNAMVILSLVAFVIFYFIKCKSSIKGLYKKDVEIDFHSMSIAAGIILIAGMLHTEFTISIIQFVSYGILIVAILVKYFQIANTQINKIDFWLSFVYFVVFSMAIPVSYKSFMQSAIAFHIVEFFTSIGLVNVFVYFLYRIFDNDYEALYNPFVFFITILLDSILIIWRWIEEVNVFLLVFTIASIVVYFTAYILRVFLKKNSLNV